MICSLKHLKFSCTRGINMKKAKMKLTQAAKSQIMAMTIYNSAKQNPSTNLKFILSFLSNIINYFD